MTSIQVLVLVCKIWAIPLVLILYLYISGSKTRAKAYQGIIFEKITNPEYFLRNNIRLGNFAPNGTVDTYLRDNPTPTDTEDDVQNWFNDLILNLPNFAKRLVVEDTHNSPYLDGLKPDLSVFLEEDARG